MIPIYSKILLSGIKMKNQGILIQAVRRMKIETGKGGVTDGEDRKADEEGRYLLLLHPGLQWL